MMTKSRWMSTLAALAIIAGPVPAQAKVESAH
jgi:hypothetical protein